MKYCRLIAFWALFCLPLIAEASIFSDWSVEAKASAFFPSSNKVRELSSNVLPYFDVELNKTLFCNYQFWVGAGYVYGSDRGNRCYHDKTSIQMVPVTFGLKYLWPVRSWFDFYLGAGVSWAQLRTERGSSGDQNVIKSNSWGGIFKTGFVYKCGECLSIDTFCEYLYQSFEAHHPYKKDHSSWRRCRGDYLNMSGFKLGCGIVLRF